MFNIEHISSRDKYLNYIHVKNKNYSARIYPNLGASLQELIINNTSLIKGLDLNSPDIGTYYKSYYSAILFPFSGRVENGNYYYNKKNYQLDQNENASQHALHGLIYNKCFKSIEAKAYSKEATITLEYKSDGSLQGFPFKFNIQATYQFLTKGFNLKIKVKNTDTNPFPFSIGWHPYFKTESVNETHINFNSKIAYSTNKSLIPQNPYKHNHQSLWKISDTHLDTSYIINQPVIVYESQSYSLTLDIENENKVDNFLQLYTPKDRQSIAIEPMTALPNAFNNKIGLLELYPNDNFQCKWILNIMTHD